MQKVRTLRVAGLAAKELDLDSDAILLEPLAPEAPQERPAEFVVVEANPVTSFLHDGKRFVPQEQHGKSTRAFLCHNVASKTFRLLTENGSVNTPVYPGMMVVQTSSFIQWRDAKFVYLLKFDNAIDARAFGSILIEMGAKRPEKREKVEADAKTAPVKDCANDNDNYNDNDNGEAVPQEDAGKLATERDASNSKEPPIVICEEVSSNDEPRATPPPHEEEFRETLAVGSEIDSCVAVEISSSESSSVPVVEEVPGEEEEAILQAAAVEAVTGAHFAKDTPLLEPTVESDRSTLAEEVVLNVKEESSPPLLPSTSGVDQALVVDNVLKDARVEEKAFKAEAKETPPNVFAESLETVSDAETLAGKAVEEQPEDARMMASASDQFTMDNDEEDVEEQSSVEDIPLEEVEAVMGDILDTRLHLSKATIRLSDMDTLLDEIDDSGALGPVQVDEHPEPEHEPEPECVAEEDEVPMENLDSILVDVMKTDNEDPEEVQKFVSTLRQKAGKKATTRGTIRMADLGQLLCDMAVVPPNPLASEFPETEEDRLDAARLERQAAEQEAEQVAQQVAHRALQASGCADPKESPNRGEEGVVSDDEESVVIIGGDAPAASSSNYPDGEEEKEAGKKKTTPKKKTGGSGIKLQRSRSKSFVRDDEIDKMVTALAVSPTEVSPPPAPPKRRVVRKKVKKKKKAGAPPKVPVAMAPPPAPPKKSAVAGATPSQVLKVKKAINSALSDWLGSSETTMRRVITASGMRDAPRSTEQLRSMVRMDTEIEPYSTLSKEQAAKNRLTERESKRNGEDVDAADMEPSSEESSEFVDIDFCGTRVATLEELKGRLAMASVAEESEMDDDELAALEALKGYTNND